MNMPLPPGASVSVNAPATATSASNSAANDEDEDGKADASKAIKQFSASEDANGEPIPTPRAMDVDAPAVLVELHSALVGILAKNGVTDVDAFVDAVDSLDKTTFPGNKEGRTSYYTLQALTKVRKLFEGWTKKRGDGVANTKAKLAEKDNKISMLEQQLAELRQKLGL
jgi:hypothetical protein